MFRIRSYERARPLEATLELDEHRSGTSPLHSDASGDQRRDTVLRWLVLVILVVGIGVAPGLERSLRWTAPATTAWMPCLTLAAAWSTWRARRARQLVAEFLIFTIAICALLWFEMILATGNSTLQIAQSFPTLVVPGALLFVTFLQITMVCERKPFDQLRRFGGISALAVSAGVSVVGTRFIVNWDVPPVGDAPIGLNNPGGPVAGPALITWLTLIAAWQVIVVVALTRYPGRWIASGVGRIVVNNLVVLVGATVTYFAAASMGVDGPLLAGIGACVVAGGRLPFCLYVDGVDESGRLRARVARASAWSVAIFCVLTMTTWEAEFSTQPSQLWVAVAGLNLVSGGVTFAASIIAPVFSGRST